MDDVGRKIAHYQDLALAVACPGWNGQHAQAFGPVLKPETARKKAVSAQILEGILGARSRHVHAPGKQIGPEFQVRLRIKNGCGLTGRPGRNVHPEEPILGFAQEPIGVAGSQVMFYRKRNTADIFRAGDGRRVESDLLESFAIKHRSGRTLYA